MEDFEFSWRMERQAEITYRVFEKNASSAWLKHIFSFLANAERRHYEMLQSMENGEAVRIIDRSFLPIVSGSLIGRQPRNGQLKEVMGQVQVYKAIRDREQESEAFYLEKAKETSKETHRGLFLALAEEEHVHFVLLKALIDLVDSSGAPLDTLEFANQGCQMEMDG